MFSSCYGPRAKLPLRLCVRRILKKRKDETEIDFETKTAHEEEVCRRKRFSYEQLWDRWTIMRRPIERGSSCPLLLAFSLFSRAPTTHARFVLYRQQEITCWTFLRRFEQVMKRFAIRSTCYKTQATRTRQSFGRLRLELLFSAHCC